MSSLNETENDTSQLRLLLSVGSNFVVCVFIITNNVLLLVTLARTPRLRTLPNAYMASLGATDLLVGIILVVRHFWLIPSTEWVFDKNKFVCIPFYCVLYTTGVESIMSLVLVSLDRYLYIVWPFVYERNVTVRSVKWTILLSWIFSTSFGSLAMYLNDFTPERGCNARHIFLKSFYICLVTYFLLSAMIIAAFYGQILFVMLRQKKRMLAETNRTQSTSKRSNRWGVLRFIFLVCSLFYICWLPVVITFIFHLAGNTPVIVISVTVSLAACNSALNFVVFLTMRQDFRSALKDILCEKRTSVSPEPSGSQQRTGPQRKPFVTTTTGS